MLVVVVLLRKWIKSRVSLFLVLWTLHKTCIISVMGGTKTERVKGSIPGPPWWSGPVVKTLSFHYSRHGFDPGLGNF